ncbi:energy transducer TonB [Flavobacterium panacagri]|uniref:energy transducer TonB n=1 Tax=Flavobacterium panacagri TaxID=3034146 RepID=UPI0025A577C7|nr:energy transducer TonB [Flavobacterium panacagri]
MERKYKIAIPEPCHEDWNKMIPTESGRFCMSCCKTVIDFTAMSSEEIQHYITQNQNNKICGRFKKSQLDTITIQIPDRVLYSQTHYHKMFLLALFITMGTTLFSCQGKDGNKKKIDKIEIVEASLPKKSVQKSNDTLKEATPPLIVPKIKDPPNVKVHYVVSGGLQIIEEPQISEPIDYDAVFESFSLDVIPVPAIGMEKFYAYVKDNYVIPNEAEDSAGKIYVSFIVEKDGSLSTFKIIKDIGYGTGEEAIRVLKIAPKWIPGKLNDQIVRTSFKLPFTISMRQQ